MSKIANPVSKVYMNQWHIHARPFADEYSQPSVPHRMAGMTIWKRWIPTLLLVSTVAATGHAQWVVQGGDDFDSNAAVGTGVAFHGTSVFVTGVRVPRDANRFSVSDLFLASYSLDGSLQWIAGAEGEDSDVSMDVAVGADGSVYITGPFQSTALTFFGTNRTMTVTRVRGTVFGESDAYLARYDVQGNLLWVRVFEASEMISTSGLAVDMSGNVHVSGYFLGTAEFRSGDSALQISSDERINPFIAKLDTEGNPHWVHVPYGVDVPDPMRPMLPANNRALDVAVDAQGNAFVVGTFESDSLRFDNESGGSVLYGGRGVDFFLVKYGPSGSMEWARGIDPRGEGCGEGRSVSIDPFGYAWVTGYVCLKASLQAVGRVIELEADSNRLSDIFIAKFDQDGMAVWGQLAGGSRAEIGYGIAADLNGGAYVTGFFASNPALFGGISDRVILEARNTDMFTAHFGSDGRLNGITQAGSLSGRDTNKNIRGNAVALDHAGFVYVTGHFSRDAVFNLGLDSEIQTIDTPNQDFFLAKFADLQPHPFTTDTENLREHPEVRTGTLHLSAAYPNPTAGATTFTLESEKPAYATIEVFDAMGRLIATIYDGMLASGRQTVVSFDGSGLASGLYIVRVRTATDSLVRKIIVTNTPIAR